MNQPNLAKGETSPYSCATCKEPVFLVADIIYKPCGHKNDPVLANMEAIVRGTSSVS